MKLMDGPLAEREVGDNFAGIWLSLPSIIHCDKPNCLFLHIQTDEYWIKGPNAGAWYRSYVSLQEPDEDSDWLEGIGV